MEVSRCLYSPLHTRRCGRSNGELCTGFGDLFKLGLKGACSNSPSGLTGISIHSVSPLDSAPASPKRPCGREHERTVGKDKGFRHAKCLSFQVCGGKSGSHCAFTFLQQACCIFSTFTIFTVAVIQAELLIERCFVERLSRLFCGKALLTLALLSPLFWTRGWHPVCKWGEKPILHSTHFYLFCIPAERLKSRQCNLIQTPPGNDPSSWRLKGQLHPLGNVITKSWHGILSLKWETRQTLSLKHPYLKRLHLFEAIYLELKSSSWKCT